MTFLDIFRKFDDRFIAYKSHDSSSNDGYSNDNVSLRENKFDEYSGSCLKLVPIKRALLYLREFKQKIWFKIKNLYFLFFSFKRHNNFELCVWFID